MQAPGRAWVNFFWSTFYSIANVCDGSAGFNESSAGFGAFIVCAGHQIIVIPVGLACLTSF